MIISLCGWKVRNIWNIYYMVVFIVVKLEVPWTKCMLLMIITWKHVTIWTFVGIIEEKKTSLLSDFAVCKVFFFSSKKNMKRNDNSKWNFNKLNGCIELWVIPYLNLLCILQQISNFMCFINLLKFLSFFHVCVFSLLICQIIVQLMQLVQRNVMSLNTCTAPVMLHTGCRCYLSGFFDEFLS